MKPSYGDGRSSPIGSARWSRHRASPCSTTRPTRATSRASVYDAEGLACRRNVLIEDGVLRAFVYDTVSARRAGTVSTGQRGARRDRRIAVGGLSRVAVGPR